MATRYEHWDTAAGATYGLSASVWRGQTFTPIETHEIQYVILRLNRPGVGDPGVITADIYAASGGLPTGSALASGTTLGTTLPAAPTDRQLDLDVPVVLRAGSQYAITVHASSVGQSAGLEYATVAGYAGGTYLESFDTGATWVSGSAVDFMFEEWGVPVERYMNLSGLRIPYEDLDGTKELHAILKNLSPTAKSEGVDGEVVIEVHYQPLA